MFAVQIRRVLPASLLLVLSAVMAACAPAAVPAPTLAPAATLAPVSTVAPAPTTAPVSTVAPAPTTAAAASAPTVAAAPTIAPTTGAVASTAVPEITINGADFSFQAPDTFAAGLVRVKFNNMGQELHHVQFMRLNDNVTLTQFQQSLQQGEQAALALVSLPGGVAPVMPGGSGEAVLNLPQGNYVIACFISGADGIPHLAKGMLKPIQVTAATSTATAPTADITVHLKDFTIDMPGTLPAGKTTFQVVNDGPEPHEWNLFMLAEGKTLSDVMAFFNAPPGSAPSGPPPFSPAGGVNAMSAGGTSYVQMDLKPGHYLAICNVPSFAHEGKPHSALGMMKEFTVQ